MAIEECLFKLEWDNGEIIRVSRLDEGEEEYIVLVEVEENGSWADWSHIAALAQGAFERKIKDIEEVMKS